MVERLDRRAVEETIRRCGVPVLPESVDARCSHLRRGWYWGGQAFLAKLNQLAERPVKERVGMTRARRSSPLVKSHGEEQAERWLEEGLKAAGLDKKELRALKGSDPRKLVLAELLWKRTTVSQQWLAEKLSMRSAANVSQQLRRLDRAKAMGRVPEKMRSFLTGIRTAQE
jgi:indole-3-glycerol phosphate synthase